MTETVSILTITGDIFSTIIVEKNKKYDVLDIYDLFNNNEKISETNEKFNIIYNDNVIFCNNSYIYFSDEVSFNNKNVTIVFNKNDIKIDIDISLFKKYKMMTDSNNLELTFNDIKKISLDIMINKNKYGNYHDNLLKTINNTFNIDELKELYAISALYNISILKLMPKKIKRDKEYALQLIKTSNTKKSIYIKYNIDNVANEMLSHCIEYDMLYDYQDQYLIEDQIVILYLDRSLRNDKDIIYESVKTCYLTFHYASDELKNDIEFLHLYPTKCDFYQENWIIQMFITT